MGIKIINSAAGQVAAWYCFIGDWRPDGIMDNHPVFTEKGTPIPFNPPPTLVVNGLYRIVRNPMHLGWTIVLIGLALLMQSFTLLVIFIPLFMLVHIIYLKFVEEKELEKKFGQAYLDYKQRVPMFIPRLIMK